MRTNFNMCIHDPAAKVDCLSNCVTVDFPVSEIEPVLNVVTVFLEPKAARKLGEDLMREAYRCEHQTRQDDMAKMWSEA